MATDPYTWRGIWTAAVTGLCIIAIACGLQAAFAPTVRVSCPARTSAPPDCDLRWFVAFDTVPIRRTSLPALQSAGEVEAMTSGRSSPRSVTPLLGLSADRGRTRAHDLVGRLHGAPEIPRADRQIPRRHARSVVRSHDVAEHPSVAKDRERDRQPGAPVLGLAPGADRGVPHASSSPLIVAGGKPAV
jgi:hypothetical protein